jgi:predicted esterase
MDIQSYVIPAATIGRYLIRPASTPPPWPVLVGFHGYAQTADTHLDELAKIPGADRWLVVSMFALHRFYNRAQDVVGSWMTRLDRETAAADNIRYVDDVVSRVRARYECSDRLVYAGFSQGAAMAYRAGVLGTHHCDAVIALAADLPPELRGSSWPRRPAVLVARGQRDDWFTAEKLTADLAELARQGVRLEQLEFDGAHEWTDEFRAKAGQFLATLW